MNEPPPMCSHHYCRCVRAEELCRVADRTGQGRYIAEAIGVHFQLVQCQMPQQPPPSRMN
jgi:hypothetical protein